jgi:CubicO group peptidase (beta-lactamase class C family)
LLRPIQRFPLYIIQVALCVLCIASAKADDRLSKRIEAVVPEGFSGQIVVGDAEGILYSGSFGLADREEVEPVTVGTLFDIGSITKTFTATAVLKLAADDKLDLDQTLAD